MPVTRDNPAVRERGILFKPEMVRAILAGTKTQTRRLVKPQPGKDIDPLRLSRCRPMRRGKYEHMGQGDGDDNDDDCEISIKPMCFRGDVLWVREALRPSASGVTVYAEDGTPAWLDGSESVKWKWKVKHLSARYMPRWASRITLEVTEVRVQHLQEISYEDCLAEGLRFDAIYTESAARGEYRELWESINGPGSWESNPWVFAISFRRLANGND